MATEEASKQMLKSSAMPGQTATYSEMMAVNSMRSVAETAATAPGKGNNGKGYTESMIEPEEDYSSYKGGNMMMG